jgi:MerR family transcriptional regulator, aldehyde-responsive regulator
VEILIDYMGLVQQGDRAIEARKVILIEQRAPLAARLEEMRKTLDLLNHKFEVYVKAILKKEKEMLQIEELMVEG